MSDTTPRPEQQQGDPTVQVPPPPPADPTAPPLEAPAPAAAEVPPPPPAAAYPPPPADQQPPAGYQQPPAGYQQPPAGYQQPPAGYQQPYPPQPGAAAPSALTDDRTLGMAAHGIALGVTVISGGALGFVAALVMYLVYRDRSPFARAHAANALNVQIIAGIGFVVSVVLMFVLVGFITYPLVWIFAVVVHVIGMVKANNGEWWDPPLTPKFVS